MLGRSLDERVFVSPQIAPGDIAGLHTAGVTTLICNRPDAEVSPDMSSIAMAAAAEAAGVTWVHNPLSPGMLTVDLIDIQRQAILGSSGLVFSYCASGTRSAYLWGFAMALADALATEEILEALTRAGYPAPMLGPQLNKVRPS